MTQPDTKPEQKYAVSPINGAKIPLGAHPGNTGGKKGSSGRLRRVVREKLTQIMDQHGVPALTDILTAPRDTMMVCEKCGCQQEVKPPSTDGDRIRATDVVGKYGTGTLKEISVEEVQDRLRHTVEIIQNELQPDDADRVSGLLKEVWT